MGDREKFAAMFSQRRAGRSHFVKLCHSFTRTPATLFP